VTERLATRPFSSALATSFGVLFALTKLRPSSSHGSDHDSHRLLCWPARCSANYSTAELAASSPATGWPASCGPLRAPSRRSPHVKDCRGNTLALALIALPRRRAARQHAALGRKSLTTPLDSRPWCPCSAWPVFLLFSRFIPFAKISPEPLLGVAAVGALSVTRSPSLAWASCLRRAPKPLARSSLGFIMLSTSRGRRAGDGDHVRAPVDSRQDRPCSIDDFNVLGAKSWQGISMGTTLGLLLAIYLRLVGGQLVLSCSRSASRNCSAQIRAGRSAAHVHDGRLVSRTCRTR